MDALIIVIVNVTLGVATGIATAVKTYRDRKSKKKMKKRMEEMEARVKQEEELKKANTAESRPNEPIETPSEAGYAKPYNNRGHYAH